MEQALAVAKVDQEERCPMNQEHVDPYHTPARKFADNLRDLFRPGPGGAQLHSIVGAYILKAHLRDAGFAIVPLTPTLEMEAAFRRGWFRGFWGRWAAMIAVSWGDKEY
jgi:hypothetical protein